jgi:hypothetical protein
MHYPFGLSRSGQQDFEQAERLSRMMIGQEGPLRTILVMQFLDFLRSNLILAPAISARLSTRHGPQFSEF